MFRKIILPAGHQAALGALIANLYAHRGLAAMNGHIEGSAATRCRVQHSVGRQLRGEQDNLV